MTDDATAYFDVRLPAPYFDVPVPAPDETWEEAAAAEHAELRAASRPRSNGYGRSRTSSRRSRSSRHDEPLRG